MTHMSVKGEFAIDDDTGRRRIAALEVKKRLAKEESEGLRDDQEGIINLSKFLPAELTWADTGLLLIYSALRYIRTIYLSSICIFGALQTYRRPFR